MARTDARYRPPRVARSRRDRLDVRDLLLQSAIVEFAAKGFDGASTRSIAERADAHQPQINYHFESKAALWRTAIDDLFGKLWSFTQVDSYGDVPTAEQLAIGIQRFVEFSALYPELNQIMTHEAAAPSERLDWLTETHVRWWFEYLRDAWSQLRADGVAAPIDPDLIHYVFIGAASLVYLNIAEAQLLLGQDPKSADIIKRHVDGLIGMLLPGQQHRTIS